MKSENNHGVAPHWRGPLAAWVLVLVLLLVLYRQTALGMAAIWSVSDTYAHGYVVPFISAWLVWRIRARLAPIQPKPAPLAWLLMLGVAAFWLLGDLVAVNASTHLALVALVVLSVPAVLGFALARAITFPLAFLFFAVPIGDFMLPQLMEWTADFTVLALRWTGIPVYREGLQFVIPSGNWSVVEACSGIRYLIASITVGCLFAYLSYSSTRKRVIFMGVAILVPLLANWMRAYLIVLIGHLSGNELATGVDHLIYGWVFFGFVIMVMLFIGARWADPVDQVNQAVAPMNPQAPAAVPVPTKALWQSVVAVALVVASPHLAGQALQWSVSAQPVQLASLEVQPPWQPLTQAPTDWRPSFQQVSAEQEAGFQRGDNPSIGLRLSYYRQQTYERKLVTSSNVLVTSDDKSWTRLSGGQHQTSLAGQPLRVASAVLRQQGRALTENSQRLLVWKFYWVNGVFTASDVKAKIHGALSLLGGNGDDGAIVLLYAPLNMQVPEKQALEQASTELSDFLETQGAALENALQRTREAR